MFFPKIVLPEVAAFELSISSSLPHSLSSSIFTHPESYCGSLPNILFFKKRHQIKGQLKILLNIIFNQDTIIFTSTYIIKKSLSNSALRLKKQL